MNKKKLKEICYKFYLMGKSDAWLIHFEEEFEKTTHKLKLS